MTARSAAVAILAGVAALALAACERPADTAKGQARAPAPAAAQAPAPSLAAAFEIAFGRPAPARRSVTKGEQADTWIYDPARLIPVGERLALVSTGRHFSDCHVCAGALAVHYLERAPEGGWRTSGAWPEIIYGGGFGQPPEWRVREDLGHPLVIQAEAGSTGQGYTCASATLMELTASGPVIRADQIPTHYDNQGAVGEGEAPTVIDGAIGRGPDGRLRVTYTGTKRAEVDYALRESRYVPVAGPADIARC